MLFVTSDSDNSPALSSGALADELSAASPHWDDCPTEAEINAAWVAEMESRDALRVGLAHATDGELVRIINHPAGWALPGEDPATLAGAAVDELADRVARLLDSAA